MIVAIYILAGAIAFHVIAYIVLGVCMVIMNRESIAARERMTSTTYEMMDKVAEMQRDKKAEIDRLESLVNVIKVKLN